MKVREPHKAKLVFLTNEVHDRVSVGSNLKLKTRDGVGLVPSPQRMLAPRAEQETRQKYAMMPFRVQLGAAKQTEHRHSSSCIGETTRR